MRRAPRVTTALFAAAGLALCAGTASAQSPAGAASEARGLRYLSWAGRGEPARPAPVASAVTAPDRSADPGQPRLRRPNTVIPHGGFATAVPAPTRPGLTPAPGARRGLTPANAWMQPTPPAPAPAPMTPAPVARSPAPPPAARNVPDYLPDRDGRGQPVPAEIIRPPEPAPAVAAAPLDPMAPRRDAPIFRMQRDAPAAPAAAPVVEPAAAAPGAAPQPARTAEVVNSGERPPQQGGRYYSVHRQNGRQPDTLNMPEPTYVDALAVSMPETIASQDLAAPPESPALIRDAQGRIRPVPAGSDGDHQ